MKSGLCPSNDYPTEPVSKNDKGDELWVDEDFADDLADAINQNFVLEVEASHCSSKNTKEWDYLDYSLPRVVYNEASPGKADSRFVHRNSLLSTHTSHSIRSTQARPNLYVKIWQGTPGSANRPRRGITDLLV